MNKSLVNKVIRLKKSITLLFAAFLLFGNYAKAQIMYTDFTPDLTGPPTVTTTVLGEDFTWSMAPGNQFAFITSSFTEPLIMKAPNTTNLMLFLTQGQMIAPSSSWNADAWAASGTVLVENDKYLGFRVGTGTAGSYRYGWFRVSVNSNNPAQWTIKDYAFQQTPNTAIAAGDMGGTANVPVTAITVNGQGNASTITTNGGTLQMTAVVTPANATNQAVTWSVTNGTGSAAISTTGLLTAQGNGTVTVKATAQDGSNVSGNKVITITNQVPANVTVTAIAVNGQGGASTITINGGTLQMAAVVTPASATNQAVTWTVTPAGLATINAAGLLTAQANGAVTVKATAQDGSNVSGTKTITISGQTVGIKEINRIASSIYPNPVKNEVMLQFGKEEIIRNIRISNVADQVVYKIDDAGKSKLISINTASLPEGLYILTFENAEGKQGLQKFVKNK